MFGFLKELKESFQEGIEEARQELAEEEQAEASQNAAEQVKIQEIIGGLPSEEKYLSAIAAPFRATAFADWFSVFENDDPEEDYWPLHLFTFGNEAALTNKQKDNLRKLLERDFRAVDRRSALKAAAAFLGIISDALSVYEGEDDKKLNEFWREATGTSDDSDVWVEENSGETEGCPEEDAADTSLCQNPLKNFFKAQKALCCVTSAHVLLGAVDLGYIEKETALSSLRDVQSYVHENYVTWQEFGECFLEGEKNIGFNQKLGRKILSKQVKNLTCKAGSPWQNVTI